MIKPPSQCNALGGDEISVATMNVYGQPPHAQHVYLPSFYQGKMNYSRKFYVTFTTQSHFFYLDVTSLSKLKPLEPFDFQTFLNH